MIIIGSLTYLLTVLILIINTTSMVNRHKCFFNHQSARIIVSIVLQTTTIRQIGTITIIVWIRQIIGKNMHCLSILIVFFWY